MTEKYTAGKPDKLVSYLKEKIYSGEFAAGGKIPTLRSLMAQFGLTYGTAKRGVDQLCAAGLLEKRAGNGTFVRARHSETAEKRKYCLSVFVTGVDRWEHPGIYQTVFLGIQKSAAEYGCRIVLNYILMDDIDNQAVWDAGENSDAVILLSEYDIKLKNIKSQVPVIGVCMHDAGNKISLLDLDPFRAAQVAADYFVAEKCRFIQIYHTEAPSYRNRAEIFAGVWRGLGYECTVSSVEKNKYTKPNTSTEGLFFATGALLQVFAESHHAETGNSINDDFAVLSLDGKSLLDPAYLHMPTIAIDWQTLGQYTVDECLFRIKNPGALPRRIYLPGTLEK